MFNFFKKKVEEPEEYDGNLIEIKFNVNHDGEVEHEILWSQNSEQFANSIGKLLYMIHTGDFTNESVALLKKHSEIPENESFVACVLNKWASLKKEQMAKDDEDEPLVPPDMFIGNKNDDDEE